ncbi:helix-turn-helix domain-containing protein [Olivibacter sp. 47]|uniref:helix-turn-helix domain-containing protein n=1 Tax=Olivibacter sp. 47 TaxID=3056486 RepID=UPI0025A455B0|nr:helix-turn-helix domain-containing protein [Olivibacter sp. 47]MDM8176918.1 helix-turn-helix domain-containing protein [Olivibacter sp. 47]
MKKTLKQFRTQHHLSQQQLAEKSAVSLRTIQRIESGVSTGSPYVIRQLCDALHIAPDELMLTNGASILNQQDITLPVKEESNAVYDNNIKYINFSALIALCFPFMNLIIPVVLRYIFRKSLTDKHNKAAANKILSLHIWWSVVTLIALIATPVADLYLFKIGEVLEIPLFIWCYLIFLIALVLIILKTANDINREKELLIFVPNIV